VLVPIIVIWPGWVVAVRGHPRDVAVLDGSVQVRSGTFLGAVFLAELAQRARRVPTVGLRYVSVSEWRRLVGGGSALAILKSGMLHQALEFPTSVKRKSERPLVSTNVANLGKYLSAISLHL
jgi:hypothetical protein